MYLIVLLSIAIGELLATLYYPVIIDALINRAPEVLSDSTSIKDMLVHWFPSNVAGSLGVLSANILAFYSMVIIFIANNMLTEEIKNGRWIIPLGAGYKKSNLILSKAIVNSIGAAFPVFVIYNMYYFMCWGNLENNFTFVNVFTNALIICFIIFVITNITIFTSVIFKKNAISAITIIMVIIVTPDLFNMFSFRKWLPTYLLTYVTSSMNDVRSAVISLFECLILVVVLYGISLKQVNKIEVNR